MAVLTDRTQFIRELSSLINKYSFEQDSNTPDYILAEHLTSCLDTYNATVIARARWYGRIDVPGGVSQSV